MFKNIIILVLLVTNACSIYYIYEHFDPQRNVTTNKQRIYEKPKFFYRVHMVGGGLAEAQSYKDKGTRFDLFDNGKITMTIPKSNIIKLEKVYYKAQQTGTSYTNKVEIIKHN